MFPLCFLKASLASALLIVPEEIHLSYDEDYDDDDDDDYDDYDYEEKDEMTKKFSHQLCFPRPRDPHCSPESSPWSINSHRSST